MPTYEYKCVNEECKDKDKTKDIICKIAERDEQVCPECSEKLSRGVSGIKVPHVSWSQWRAV